MSEFSLFFPLLFLCVSCYEWCYLITLYSNLHYYLFYYIMEVFSLLLLTFPKIGMEVEKSRDNGCILSYHPDSKSKGITKSASIILIKTV